MRQNLPKIKDFWKQCLAPPHFFQTAPGTKGVGVAENPRSGVGARGSSVKKRKMYGKICYALPSIALPLLDLLILVF
jgi:hypothetical protein